MALGGAPLDSHDGRNLGPTGIILECTFFVRRLSFRINSLTSLKEGAMFIPPENQHDNGRHNHLKMYLLLKIVIFHCHLSFLGGRWLLFPRINIQP